MGRKPAGEPFVVMSGGLRELAETRKVQHVWINLSHAGYRSCNNRFSALSGAEV